MLPFDFAFINEQIYIKSKHVKIPNSSFGIQLTFKMYLKVNFFYDYSKLFNSWGIKVQQVESQISGAIFLWL